MKKTLAWYKRNIHPEWKIELKLREENNKLIFYRIEIRFNDNIITTINFGEVCPENMTKAINTLKNNI